MHLPVPLLFSLLPFYLQAVSAQKLTPAQSCIVKCPSANPAHCIASCASAPPPSADAANKINQCVANRCRHNGNGGTPSAKAASLCMEVCLSQGMGVGLGIADGVVDMEVNMMESKKMEGGLRREMEVDVDVDTGIEKREANEKSCPSWKQKLILCEYDKRPRPAPKCSVGTGCVFQHGGKGNGRKKGGGGAGGHGGSGHGSGGKGGSGKGGKGKGTRGGVPMPMVLPVSNDREVANAANVMMCERTATTTALAAGVAAGIVGGFVL